MTVVAIEIFMLFLGIIVIASAYYLDVLLWGLIITSNVLILFFSTRFFQNIFVNN